MADAVNDVFSNPPAEPMEGDNVTVPPFPARIAEPDTPTASTGGCDTTVSAWMFHTSSLTLPPAAAVMPNRYEDAELSDGPATEGPTVAENGTLMIWTPLALTMTLGSLSVDGETVISIAFAPVARVAPWVVSALPAVPVT